MTERTQSFQIPWTWAVSSLVLGQIVFITSKREPWPPIRRNEPYVSVAVVEIFAMEQLAHVRTCCRTMPSFVYTKGYRRVRYSVGSRCK